MRNKNIWNACDGYFVGSFRCGNGLILTNLRQSKNTRIQLIMAFGCACAGQYILKTTNKCLYILKWDGTIKRTPSHKTTGAYDCSQGNRKKKQQIMQPTITGNSLWESHQHTTIVKMDGSFTFCPLEEEEKKQRRTKNMQWNLQRKTNKCQNNRSRFFQWGSWTLQCIDDRAKAMSDWLTEWCYIYMCFFFLFICVHVQFRKLSYDQIQSNGCAFYVYVPVQ